MRPFGVWALICSHIFVIDSQNCVQLWATVDDAKVICEHFLKNFTFWACFIVACCISIVAAAVVQSFIYNSQFTERRLYLQRICIVFISPARHLYATSGASVSILWAHEVHKIQQFNKKTF